jgi:hypothetical protein
MTGFLQRLAARAQGAETAVTVRQRTRYEPAGLGQVSHRSAREIVPIAAEAELFADDSSPVRTTQSRAQAPASSRQPSRAILRPNPVVDIDHVNAVAAQRASGTAVPGAVDPPTVSAASVRETNRATEKAELQKSTRSTDLVGAIEDPGLETVPGLHPDAKGAPMRDREPGLHPAARPNNSDRRETSGDVDRVAWAPSQNLDVDELALPAERQPVPEPGLPSDIDLVLDHVVPALIRAGVLSRGEQVRLSELDRADPHDRPAKDREPPPGTAVLTTGRPRRDGPAPTGGSRQNLGSRQNSAAQGPPQVHVHIDRIEVLRAKSPPTPVAPARREPPRVDHAAYLERRRADRR